MWIRETINILDWRTDQNILDSRSGHCGRCDWSFRNSVNDGVALLLLIMTASL